MDGWCRVWLWCAQYNLHAVDLRMFLHLLTYSASPVGHFTLCSRNLHEALHSRLAYFCVCSLLAILSTVPTPSPSVFPSPIQPSRTAAAAKDVKVFCAENSHFLKMWMAGIRMAKVCPMTHLTHSVAPTYVRRYTTLLQQQKLVGYS